MYRDMWGCIGMQADWGEAIQVFFFCGDEKTKKFVWGMCGDIPMHYFFGGVAPQANFAAWEFDPFERTRGDYWTIFGRELHTQILLHEDLFGEDLRGSVIQGC